MPLCIHHNRRTLSDTGGALAQKKSGSASQLRPRSPPTWPASWGTSAHSLDPNGGGPGQRVEAYCLRRIGTQFESKPPVLTSLRRDPIATSHNHRRFKPTRPGKGMPCARTVIEPCGIPYPTRFSEHSASHVHYGRASEALMTGHGNNRLHILPDRATGVWNSCRSRAIVS